MTGWCWGIWQEKSELGDIICVSNLRDIIQNGVTKVNSWIPWVATVEDKAHSSINTQKLWPEGPAGLLPTRRWPQVL